MKKVLFVTAMLTILTGLLFATTEKSLQVPQKRLGANELFYQEKLELLKKYGWDEKKFREEITSKKGNEKDEVGQERNFMVHHQMQKEQVAPLQLLAAQ